MIEIGNLLREITSKINDDTILNHKYGVSNYNINTGTFNSGDYYLTNNSDLNKIRYFLRAIDNDNRNNNFSLTTDPISERVENDVIDDFTVYQKRSYATVRTDATEFKTRPFTCKNVVYGDDGRIKSMYFEQLARDIDGMIQ